MTKQELRQNYQEKRNSLNQEQISAYSDAIFHQLSKLDIWDYHNYMAFYPIKEKKEVDTTELISELWKQHKNVFLPKVNEDEMEALPYTPDTLLDKNLWGITEPEGNDILPPNEIEVFFIPMLICDSKGNRVGYGKGYYDKYLTEASPSAVKIGLNFFAPIQEDIATESTDISLDYCVTPNEVLSFLPKS